MCLQLSDHFHVYFLFSFDLGRLTYLELHVLKAESGFESRSSDASLSVLYFTGALLLQTKDDQSELSVQ